VWRGNINACWEEEHRPAPACTATLQALAFGRVQRSVRPQSVLLPTLYYFFLKKSTLYYCCCCYRLLRNGKPGRCTASNCTAPARLVVSQRQGKPAPAAADPRFGTSVRLQHGRSAASPETLEPRAQGGGAQAAQRKIAIRGCMAK